MENIFSNSMKRNDYLSDEMLKYAKNSEVSIAVAFFTNENFLMDLINNGCSIRLLVRLGFPTDGISLRRIFEYKHKIQIKYYTSKSFHPKLYIFENDIAFLGSSNLTNAGIKSNQELNVSIDSEDILFEELKDVFEDYWEEAHVLTMEIIKEYIDIVRELNTKNTEVEKAIFTKFGNHSYPNIIRIDKNKKSKSREFEQGLLKRYQSFVQKFITLKEIYESTCLRKASQLPLRIEIDQFLNWLREEKAYGDNYKRPSINTEEIREFTIEKIKEFYNSDYEYLDTTTVNYITIMKNLGSTEDIDSINEDQLSECLLSIHAFLGQVRHNKGGRIKFVNDFINSNGMDRIKESFKYLLFCEDSYTKKITNCIYNSDYKLIKFGQSCVQELFGWANKEEVPICNERTYKSMQYLGFGKL
ncbi:phospholipase D-like domain-containing protein [Paenibacillus sp. Soil750]|uniref:phospholipase D-like domain-containing protein n=1 Tax=Paenibacillus sp. Soil750 TaxID=1736398 RepID=UPI0006F50879|nr:phospholipase D-like domain-containing protein [Paenibacillus sp. Soil750]KRE70883.1 hypothetical protein ASL11_11360 [Paenibacillus sp. Soil750]